MTSPDVESLVAALDAARSENGKLRQNQWPEWSQMLTPQSCQNGEHADWFVDSERNHLCPWCERDQARLEVADLRSALDRVSRLADDWDTRLPGVTVEARYFREGLARQLRAAVGVVPVADSKEQT